MNASDDRDRALERLLRQSARAAPSGATESCLDAEQLAAWAEGSLSGHELEVAQAHVADCVRCQGMLATLTVIARDATTEHTRAASAPANRRWLAWLVPLSAAAAALAIWVAVPRGPAVSPSLPAADNQRQAAKETTPAPAAAPERQPPAATGALQSTPQKRDQAEADKAKLSDLRKDSDQQELDRLKQESARNEPAPAAKAVPSPAPPAAPPPAAAAAAPPAREVFESRSANAASADQKVAADAVVSSLAAGIRWRLSGARVERSADRGTTWEQVPVPIASELTAISAPSAAVCWAVGRGGVVLRATDGRNFSRVAFPETVDLSAVQATDAQSAAVTARDGRTFRTADGGRTWAP